VVGGAFGRRGAHHRLARAGQPFETKRVLPLDFGVFVFSRRHEEKRRHLHLGGIEAQAPVGRHKTRQVVLVHAESPGDELIAHPGKRGPALHHFRRGLGDGHLGHARARVEHAVVHDDGLDAFVVLRRHGHEASRAADAVDGQPGGVHVLAGQGVVYHRRDGRTDIRAEKTSLLRLESLSGEVGRQEVVAPVEGLGPYVEELVLGEGLRPADHDKGRGRGVSGGCFAEVSRQGSPFEGNLDVFQCRLE